MNLATRRKIREAYKSWKPRSDPYRYLDWSNLFTPIEENVWHDIRYLGLPLYPQFPVGEYFIDFADPVMQIGIEVDGKKYHSTPEQQRADKKRQRLLEKQGWIIYRIPGRFTWKQYEDYFKEDEEVTEEKYNIYLTECSEGILKDIYKPYQFS